MDYDFIPRLQKLLEDFYQTKFNSLFTTKDSGDLREIIGQLRAIGHFHQMIADAGNIQPKKETVNDGRSTEI